MTINIFKKIVLSFPFLSMQSYSLNAPIPFVEDRLFIPTAIYQDSDHEINKSTYTTFPLQLINPKDITPHEESPFASPASQNLKLLSQLSRFCQNYSSYKQPVREYSESSASYENDEIVSLSPSSNNNELTTVDPNLNPPTVIRTSPIQTTSNIENRERKEAQILENQEVQTSMCCPFYSFYFFH